MLKDIGVKIRILRKQKGLGLEDLASKLGVSRAYLSNLETSKTDSIQLSVLEKLQDELNLFPEEMINGFEQETEFDLQLKKIHHLLQELHQHDPKDTEFLLHIIEKRYEMTFGECDTSLDKNHYRQEK
ncbi:helix-turn-helix domain-containing protein [Anaerobacillus sp. MEB173]|uniref:helix-turn-helix domain-containing protein n=1 Tax=Anaerobacillus sp. MEB173 TaxID=3383345 RepID=UPI003F906B4D